MVQTSLGSIQSILLLHGAQVFGNNYLAYFHYRSGIHLDVIQIDQLQLLDPKTICLSGIWDNDKHLQRHRARSRDSCKNQIAVRKQYMKRALIATHMGSEIRALSIF